MMGNTYTRGVLGFAVALAALVVGGCGSNNESASTSGQTTGGKQYSIALVQGLKGNPFHIGVACGAQSVVERANVTFSVDGPATFDPAVQADVIAAVAAKQPDGVIAAPDDPVALYRPLKEVVDGGAKLVLFDGTLERDEIADSVVLSDNDDGGRQAAQVMADGLGGRGKVLVLTDAPGNVIQTARANSFKEAAKGLGLTVVSTEYTQGDVGRASAAVGATLVREGDLAGVYATGGIEEQGALAALRDAGKSDSIKLVAYADGQDAAARVEKGEIYAMISQQPFEEGRLAATQMINVLEGKPVEHDIKVPVAVITKDNLDSPRSQAVINASSC